MKTILAMLALALASVAGVGAAVALAGSEGGEDKVTLCHAAGLDGTTQFVTITVARPAAFGPAGHFDENGTPNAGHEQDYLGACDGDETTPTTTTPTTTTPTIPDDPPPTTTTPTVTQPPHVVTGAASVICDRGSFVYRVSGTIDGQAADSVAPATIPGSFAGTTNVVVTRGDTTFRTSVTTNGDCGPPTSSTPSSTTPAVPTTPPAATPPATTSTTESSPGQPAEANPPAANSPQPKTPQPAKPSAPKTGEPVKPGPDGKCPPNTTIWNGRCSANVMGKG